MSDTYLTLQIYRIRIALLKEGFKVQCVVSYKNHRYELSNFEGKDAVFQWQDLLFNFDIKQNELDQKFKIEVLKKKGKIFSLLGSQEFEFKNFIKNINRGTETTFDIEKKSKYAGSFHFNVETTSWKLVRDYLKDAKEIDKALSILTELAKNNTSKLSSYLSSGVFQELMALQRSITVASPDAKNIEIINKLLPMWELIVGGQDNNLRKKLVDSGLLDFFSEMITIDLEVTILGFMNCLKSFFTFSSHQEQMIKTGVMKTLIKSLRSKNTKVFFKAAEVLFYFDEKYQKEMIKNGMIKQLMKVLTNKSSSSEARTKSMSLLQYFDTKYQDELVSAGTLKQIIKIIQADSETFVEGVVVKALAVIQRFTVEQLRDYVKEGFLNALLSLMTLHGKPKVQECTTDLVEKMLKHFHDEMIEAGYLNTLKKLLEDLNLPTPLVHKYLSLLSSEPADLLIKYDCVPSITSLLQSNDTQLKLMTLRILTRQFSLQQLIDSKLLPMLRLWLTGEEVTQISNGQQIYTNPFMNAWAYGVVATLTEDILKELLTLLLSIAKSDVTAFFAEDLLTPVVKLLRHASEDIYQQAGALIDFVQEKSPEKVLQSGYLEELLMTLAKANRYSAPYRRLAERFKQVPLLYPDFIEYMKQWPEMINLLVEDLTTSANWHLGRIFVDEFVVKAPEYLTQFGLVKQFALKSDSQPALAPIVEKLQNAEDILVEPKCMQALHNNLSGYRKVEFLRLTSNILRNLFQKYPMESTQFHLVADVVKIFFNNNSADVIELAYSLVTVPVIEDTAFADTDTNELIEVIFGAGGSAPRRKLMLRWLSEHPVFLTMTPEKQKELYTKLLGVVFESLDKEVVNEATRILGIMSTPESLAELFMAKKKVPYCDVVLDAFDSSDFVINDKTVTLCRNESSSEELMPEDGGHWCSIGSAQSIEYYQDKDLITATRYFEVRIDNTSKSRIVIGLAMESVQELEYRKHHAFKPWQQHIAPWQTAVSPAAKANVPEWARSPWNSAVPNSPMVKSTQEEAPRFSKLSSVGYNCEDGTILVNGVADGPHLTSFGPPLKTGDVLGIHIEIGTSTLSFSVNNKFLGTPAFPNFIFSMFDDGDSITFLPEPVVKISRAPVLHMDRYFENAISLIIKKTSQFPQTRLLYKASVDGWANAVMHGKIWGEILFSGTVFLLKSSQNNKRVNTKAMTSDAEPVRNEVNVFAVYCGQKSHIHSNYERPYSISTDSPAFVASISRDGARPFLAAEEFEAKKEKESAENNNNANNSATDTNDNNNNNSSADEAPPPPGYTPPPPPPPRVKQSAYAVLPPENNNLNNNDAPDYIPPPPPPPQKQPLYVPLPQQSTTTTLRALIADLNAPKKAPNRRNSLTLDRGGLLDQIRNIRAQRAAPVPARPKVPVMAAIPRPNTKLPIANARRYANLLTPRAITTQNCSAYQAKLVYMVQNGEMKATFEDRNKLKIITPDMVLSDVLDASIVLDIENQLFHVVNIDLEWDTYKLDEIEIYSGTNAYQLRWLVTMLRDLNNKWISDVLKSCYQIDPELVTLELQAAYQDPTLPDDVRGGLESFVQSELHIDVDSWAREAEHPLIHASAVVTGSLAAYETPLSKLLERPAVQASSYTNILAASPPPPAPPPPPGNVRERVQRANQAGGRLNDAIRATTEELDKLLDELNITPTIPDTDDVTLEGLLRQLEQPAEDKSESESESASESSDTGSGSGSGSASDDEPAPRRVLPPRLPRVVANFPQPPPPIVPQENRVPCPVCGTMILDNLINEHLDECLTMQVM